MPRTAPPIASGASSLTVPGRPVVMGVVNVTPDSFSDGGLYADTAAAIAHARRLLADGADVSTSAVSPPGRGRPGRWSWRSWTVWSP